jgi:hypothetical protein
MASDAPNITAVQAAGGRSVAVSWKSGGESIVDLSDFLARFAIFRPLREDDALFARVTLGEWGWSIGWRRGHHLTQAAAARALGVSPRMWRYYEAGSHLLPKTVRLAAIGLDAEARAA